MKYIIFDIDGTLADTKEVDDKCFIQAFYQTFGVDITNENWAALQNVTDWGITEEIIQRELARLPTEKEYLIMTSNLVQLLHQERNSDNSQFQEVKGAKAFFDSLRGQEEIRLGVATGAWEQSARMKLASIKIDLKEICFSNSNFHKTREGITLEVIDQLNQKNGTTTEQIIYFGDGAWDYKTCKNLGIQFIGIDVRQNGKLKTLGAETVFKDFQEVEKILEVINKE